MDTYERVSNKFSVTNIINLGYFFYSSYRAVDILVCTCHFFNAVQYTTLSRIERVHPDIVTWQFYHFVGVAFIRFQSESRLGWVTSGWLAVFLDLLCLPENQGAGPQGSLLASSCEQRDWPQGRPQN